MSEFKKILVLIIIGFFTLSAYSQDDSKKEGVTLKLKIYLESNHSFGELAGHLTVRIDELIDKTVFEYEKKTGRFSLNLSMDKHYVLYFTQEGYETKSMLFSTVGADKNLKYIFRADVMLKKVDAKNVIDHTAMASIKFDYMNKNQFVIHENYSRIVYSVKSK